MHIVEINASLVKEIQSLNYIAIGDTVRIRNVAFGFFGHKVMMVGRGASTKNHKRSRSGLLLYSNVVFLLLLYTKGYKTITSSSHCRRPF